MEQDNLVIGFSRSKGLKPFSWLIRLFEGTRYSHAYIRVYNSHFEDYDVYQASKGMVNHILESTFLEENEVLSEFSCPITKDDKKELLIDLRKRLGRPYAMWAIIGIFFKKFGIVSRWFYDGEHSYICSELVARILQGSGKLDVQTDLDRITPKGLYELALKHFEKIK